MKTLFDILKGWLSNPPADDKPVIRYADPSHAPGQPRSTKPAERYVSKTGHPPLYPHPLPARPSSAAVKSPFARFRKSGFDQALQDPGLLETLTLDIVNAAGRSGLSFHEINRAILLKLELDADTILSSAINRVALAAARKSLQSKKQVGYNRVDEVWYPLSLRKAKPKTKLIAPKNSALDLGEIHQEWIRISDKLECISWLYRNLTPDEFEIFCCVILSYCSVTSVTTTSKRAGSNADGGFDGQGIYQVDGVPQPVVFEAKRHALDSQIGTDIGQKLIGAMMGQRTRYGFLITTARLSERNRTYLQSLQENTDYPIYIEMIDADRLADIMLKFRDSGQGLGLRQDELGQYYMNPSILRKSIASYDG